MFSRDMCNDVPIQYCAESQRGMMFGTASGQKAAHGSIRIMRQVIKGNAARPEGTSDKNEMAARSRCT